MDMHETETVNLSGEQLKQWGRQALSICKMPDEEKEIILDVLVTTNLRGVDTHGINLLPLYIERYNTFPPKPIQVEKDFAAVCMVNGGENLGTVVSHRCMEMAMEKASQFGVGVVMAYNSGHFGAAAHYTYQAAQKGFIGYCSTTALVNMPAWGGMDEIAGKNPFSISFPGDKFPIVLDIACSVAARQKVLTARREGWKIPEGWALDKNGNPTTDPNEALEGVFLPMAEHKGIGLAMMIELLCGCLCQSGFSIDVTNTDILTGPQNISHMFVAIDPKRFLTKEEMDKQCAYISEKFHNGRRRPGVDKLYLPGELEWDEYQKRTVHGVPLAMSRVKELDAFSEKIGVTKVRDIPR